MINERERVQLLKEKLSHFKGQMAIMEVCGTHTMALAKHAIRSLLPKNIEIISGPGCPVCVTSASDIHAAITLSQNPNFIIATFGDMLKVPSRGETLSGRSNVKVVYSPLEALTLAQKNPTKEIIFLGIGFETTTPLIAQSIKQAKDSGIKNFSVISMHKKVPEALEAILGSPDNRIHALLLPGHVSAIVGRKYFDFIKKYEVGGVITGFEAVDIMEAIYILAQNFTDKKVEVLNNYTRLVKEDGNPIAMKMMYEVYESADAHWRGIGVIPQSGLEINSKYSAFDAKKKFNLENVEIPDPKGCLCGTILMGKAKPPECKLFKTACTPSNPVGPCMVSGEGTCAAYFKYNIGE